MRLLGGDMGSLSGSGAGSLDLLLSGRSRLGRRSARSLNLLGGRSRLGRRGARSLHLLLGGRSRLGGSGARSAVLVINPASGGSNNRSLGGSARARGSVVTPGVVVLTAGDDASESWSASKGKKGNRLDHFERLRDSRVNNEAWTGLTSEGGRKIEEVQGQLCPGLYAPLDRWH